MIYLDGNSLGPLPKSVSDAVQYTLCEQWGQQLIKGWNVCNWMEQPTRVGNSIAAIIGAPDGSVVMGDTLSIKVFQALAAALAMRPERKIILSDSGNFPTDLYMAEGLVGLKEQGYQLNVVEPDAIKSAMNETVAVVLLTEIDYRTGRRYSIADITTAARECGSVMVWDLAHWRSGFYLRTARFDSNCDPCPFRLARTQLTFCF